MVGGIDNVKGINGTLYPIFKCDFSRKEFDITQMYHRWDVYYLKFNSNPDDVDDDDNEIKEKLACTKCGYLNKKFLFFFLISTVTIH